MTVWKPHVTVAAVIEQQQRFLFVEEETVQGLAFNQPAGHLEEGEDFIQAIKREVLEETAWQFEPSHVVGVQLWRKNPDFPSFVRICFTGSVHSHDEKQPLDAGIVATHWLSYYEISQRKMRSPLVLTCVEEYLSGARYPLSLLKAILETHES